MKGRVWPGPPAPATPTRCYLSLIHISLSEIKLDQVVLLKNNAPYGCLKMIQSLLEQLMIHLYRELQAQQPAPPEKMCIRDRPMTRVRPKTRWRAPA